MKYELKVHYVRVYIYSYLVHELLYTDVISFQTVNETRRILILS